MSRRYRHAERLMYRFPMNIVRITVVSEALKELRARTDCHAQKYEQSLQGAGTHSDPVGAYADKIMQLEGLLVRLRKEAEPVLKVRQSLKLVQDEREQEMFIVLERFYFEKADLSETAQELGKSERTLRRRREELVREVMRELEAAGE